MVFVDTGCIRNVPKLLHQISKDKFKQQNLPIIRGLSHNPATGELFLADSNNCNVIVLSPQEADARVVIVYRSKKRTHQMLYASCVRHKPFWYASIRTSSTVQKTITCRVITGGPVAQQRPMD